MTSGPPTPSPWVTAGGCDIPETGTSGPGRQEVQRRDRGAGLTGRHLQGQFRFFFFFENFTSLPLHSTSLAFLFRVTPSDGFNPRFSRPPHQDTWTRWAGCRQRLCNTNTPSWEKQRVFGAERASIREWGTEKPFLRASVSPTLCRGALVGVGLRGLCLQAPPAAPATAAANGPASPPVRTPRGAQPCRAGRSHSPPLAAIFTCPVSKGDATRRRHPSPPPLPSRASSWPNPRLWLPPFPSYAAAAAAKAKVSAFPALRRRHVRKPAVRHRVQWAEVGRGGGRRRAGASEPAWNPVSDCSAGAQAQAQGRRGPRPPAPPTGPRPPSRPEALRGPSPRAHALPGRPAPVPLSCAHAALAAPSGRRGVRRSWGFVEDWCALLSALPLEVAVGLGWTRKVTVWTSVFYKIAPGFSLFVPKPLGRCSRGRTLEKTVRAAGEEDCSLCVCR